MSKKKLLLIGLAIAAAILLLLGGLTGAMPGEEGKTDTTRSEREVDPSQDQDQERKERDDGSSDGSESEDFNLVEFCLKTPVAPTCCSLRPNLPNCPTSQHQKLLKKYVPGYVGPGSPYSFPK